jgi:hypothetical protein
VTRLASRSLAWTLALALAGCGGDGATADTTSPSTPYIIRVSNYAEDPANLGAPAGATILFQNFDDFPHWFSSSAAPGVYVHSPAGGVDLDLYLPPGAVTPFELPAGLAAGAIVPYFCFLHRAAERTAGSITILAPAAALAP